MGMGLVGRKCGMTRLFKEDGRAVPVTVVHVDNNVVTQLKTMEKDGYTAVQISAGSKKPSRLNRSELGHFAKAGVTPGKGLWEFRIPAEVLEQHAVGTGIPLEIFTVGQMVDVTSVSKGKGFAGAIKRHNFAGQDRSHGNSLSHRAPGSIGQNQSPGRVFKGKKMAGHMGDQRTTIQALEIMAIDTEKNVLLISGAIPGATGADVIVCPSVKRTRGTQE
jgi:large subunit ribosomal protein L3